MVADLIAFFVAAHIAGAVPIKRGEIIETFDPFGDENSAASKEEEAIQDLIPRLMFSFSYGYTYRTGFPKENIIWAEEQMHLWTIGAHYMPWTFLFAGISAPIAMSKLDGVARVLDVDKGQNFEPLRTFDWVGGFGDLSTYVGSELPWFPLSITFCLMWPTGDIEKGMGTGEFSYGFTADYTLSLGKLRATLGGYYFVLLNPTVNRNIMNSEGKIVDIKKVVLDLPDTYGASLSLMVPVFKARIGSEFKWSRRTLITWNYVHVLEPSLKVIWPVTKNIAAIFNTAIEVYPTFAVVPTVLAIWSI